MFRLLLVLMFIVVPIAELAVLIQVGQAIGVWWTILLLVADAVLGSMLARSQGRATWRRFNEALQDGRQPAREVLDGALVLFGGALLLTPGFITDVFGLLLLLPPTRALFRAMLVRRLMDRMLASMATPRGSRMRPRQDYDVEGTAVEREPDGLGAPGASDGLDRGTRPRP
jgi:UPF0716 protein FxsA